MKTKLQLDLADILKRKYPGGFHAPADIDIDTLLEFGDEDWEHELDLGPLLERDGQVAILLSTDDVRSRRPDLTEDQAWEVLRMARGDFLRDGGHLEYLQKVADGMFMQRAGHWRVDATLFVDDFQYSRGKAESVLSVLQGQVKALAKDIDIELDLETLVMQPIVKPEGGAK